MSDSIVVMNGGRIEQKDKLENVYRIDEVACGQEKVVEIFSLQGNNNPWWLS